MIGTGRKKSIVFFIALGAGLIVVTLLLYIGGVVLDWQRGNKLVQFETGDALRFLLRCFAIFEAWARRTVARAASPQPATQIAAKAHVVVSGDRHLLALRNWYFAKISSTRL